eukprot:1740448-Rhodomonas_salina.1
MAEAEKTVTGRLKHMEDCTASVTADLDKMRSLPAVRCAVLTETVYGPTLWCGTEIAYGATAACGTEIVYGL